ncbi:MAG: peptidoglycan-binding protein [Candidatus Actinomarina sp.]
MKQGLKKTTFFLIAFFATTLLINLQKEPAFAHKVPTSITLNCADNAVAPLNNLKDIQTFLNCNGFNPGPIDGLAGSRTDGAIKSFQKTVGLVADGEVGPATKQAMRSYSSVSFTFQGSGWGHGVGLSQYGTKGLTELGASFCSNTSSCSSNEVVSYYFQGTSVKQLSEINLSSPDISTNNNALWVGLARNARSINLTTLPSSSPPTLFICQDNLPQVAGVQAFLSSRGFDPGTVDGAFGERTANALKNYQASVGIGQSGTINDETLNKIKSDATSDGPCESDFGPLKIAGGATINIIYSNGNCYFTGHPLLSKVPASCNIGISWSDGGRIRVGPREHKHGILKLRNKNVSSGFHVSLAVNIEKYLYGLAEMPSHWNVKALEAQALVGRSYAVFQYLKQNIPSEKTDTDAGLSSSRKDYCWCHIGSTASSQYYYGYLKEIAGPNWVQAVNNTSGKVITYDGGYTQSTVVQAFYSSSTGGKTNDNVVGFGSATPWPYLKTVDDPWSVDNRVGNPKAAWSYDFSSYQLSKNILCGDTPCFDAVTDIYVSSVSESGAALQVTMKGFKNGSAKTVTKSGRNIKSQLGFTSHYFKTSSQSDISNLSIGPITANSSTTTAVENSSSSTGDTPQYATSSSGLTYLSKAGLLNVCNETSSACQAKTISREEAAAVVTVVGGVSLDAPNAYSDDDQSLYQQATNALPYYGMQVCFGSPFQIQPSETVSRDELACLLVKSIRAGTTENLSGSIDKFSDEGASKWTNEINVLAANDVIPACSDLSDKFCPSRKITIGEVSYIVNRLVDKSLIPSSVFDVNPFQAGWTANGGEVTEASSTAVSNPNAGNDACVPQDNSTLVINSTLDIQQFLSNNGFNPGPIDGQSGPKTKNAIISFQKENGLLADGIAGNKTKAAMRAYTGCKSENFCVARDNSSAKLDSIADVQTYLANNGFNPGIIDGKMGSYTREAIKAFQRKVGLIPDGVAGARTKSEMKSYTGC